MFMFIQFPLEYENCKDLTRISRFLGSAVWLRLAKVMPSIDDVWISPGIEHHPIKLHPHLNDLANLHILRQKWYQIFCDETGIKFKDQSLAPSHQVTSPYASAVPRYVQKHFFKFTNMQMR